MRKLVYGMLATVMVALVGCVTINVYFPEAAAQKAADQFIGTVLDSAEKSTRASWDQMSVSGGGSNVCRGGGGREAG